MQQPSSKKIGAAEVFIIMLALGSVIEPIRASQPWLALDAVFRSAVGTALFFALRAAFRAMEGK